MVDITIGENESVGLEAPETKLESKVIEKPRRHENDWITQEISAWLEQKTFENLCWYYRKQLLLSNRGATLNESGLSIAEVQSLKRSGVLRTVYIDGVKAAVLTDKAKNFLGIQKTRLIKHETRKRK